MFKCSSLGRLSCSQLPDFMQQLYSQNGELKEEKEENAISRVQLPIEEFEPLGDSGPPTDTKFQRSLVSRFWVISFQNILLLFLNPK